MQRPENDVSERTESDQRQMLFFIQVLHKFVEERNKEEKQNEAWRKILVDICNRNKSVN